MLKISLLAVAGLTFCLGCGSPQKADEKTEEPKDETSNATNEPTGSLSSTEPNSGLEEKPSSLSIENVGDAEPKTNTEAPKNRFRAGKATVNGMSREIVNRIFRRQKNTMTACFELALADNPEASGKVTFDFTISAKGRTENQSVTSEFNHAPSTKCFKEIVEKMTFPDPAKGTATVSAPFIFLGQ